MRKVLILGCSHSLGNWELWDKNQEYLANTYGWWSFVDVIKKDQKHIYAAAGMSWMFWSELIFEQIVNIKDFDFCVIQNTHPFRMSILRRNWHKIIDVEDLADNTKWHAFYDGEKTVNLVSEKTHIMEEILNHYSIETYMEDETNSIKNHILKRRTKKFCRDIEESPTRMIAALAHQYWLLNHFKENNFPVYIFNFDAEETFSNAVTLNCHNILNKFNSFRTYPQGHLTIEGNKRVGNLVNKELCNYVK